MGLNLAQKASVLAGALRYRNQIKNLLIRRYWQQKREWGLDFDGVRAKFLTDDFYSNYWFYGAQNVGAVYEPALTRLMIRFAARATGFLDVGANLGYFTVVVAKANPKLRVIALEIDEALAPTIQKNLSANGIGNAAVFCGAVGNGSAVVPYTPHAYSFLTRAVEEQAVYPEVRLTARTIEIDRLLEEQNFAPDLVKMDVDGAEMEALAASTRLLANPNLIMFLEVHPHLLPAFGSSAEAVGDMLRNKGFSLYFIDDFRSKEAISLRKLDTLRSLNSKTGDMLIVTRKSAEELAPA